MEEKTIETKFRKGIGRLGGLCIKMPATFFSGIPDRLCLLPGGVMFFAEIKKPGARLRSRQEYVKKQLEALRFTVYVVDSVEAAERIIYTYSSDRLTPGETRELIELATLRQSLKFYHADNDLPSEQLARYFELRSKKYPDARA
jgi:hypothetical protein